MAACPPTEEEVSAYVKAIVRCRKVLAELDECDNCILVSYPEYSDWCDYHEDLWHEVWINLRIAHLDGYPEWKGRNG